MRLFLTVRPRPVLLVLAAVLLILALLFVRGLGRPGPAVEELGRRAQEELRRTASYRFRLAIRSVIEGREAVVSEVEGEYVRPDSYHLRGRSYDYPLELYQLGRRIFFKDPADGTWKEAQGGPNLVTEAVSLGTSPLVDFLQAPSFELVGREKVGGVGCYRLRSDLGEVANPYWRVFFSDFTLESWISRATFKVHRLRLEGSNRSVPGDKLEIDLVVYNHDAPLTIALPPQLQKSQ
ncbi:MAG TPA: hypothetical protein GXX50_02935 [Firmicutes bacterium]|nr:hypothetical protein [Bacillota bacterium]